MGAGQYRGFDSNSAQRVFDCDIKTLRENTFITCFSANMSIPGNMIQEYGEIIIRTSKDKLIQALFIDESMSMTSYPVTYFEESSFSYPDMAFYQDTLYGYSLFGCKRKSYVEEEEFRLVFSNADFNSAARTNIFLNIDLNQCIDEIVVKDNATLEKIEKLNCEHGYEFKVSVHRKS